MTKEEAEAFEALPAFAAILAMRDWDDKAKVGLPDHRQSQPNADHWWCFFIVNIFPGPSTAGLKYGTLERDGATADEGLELSAYPYH